MKWTAAILLFSSLALAADGERVEIQWSEVRPGDRLSLRLTDGSAVEGTLRYRVTGVAGESLVLLDDLQIRRADVQRIFRLSPEPVVEEAPEATTERAAAPPARIVAEEVDRRPPRRLVTGLDIGPTFHSFVGVPIGGVTVGFFLGGGREPVTYGLRGSLFIGGTPERLWFAEGDFGIAVDFHIRRVHIGFFPFFGVLGAERVSASSGVVASAVVGFAGSLGVDLHRAGDKTLGIEASGKVGTGAETWELGLHFTLRYAL